MKLEISIVLFDTWNGKQFDGMGQFSVNYDFIQAEACKLFPNLAKKEGLEMRKVIKEEKRENEDF